MGKENDKDFSKENLPEEEPKTFDEKIDIVKRMSKQFDREHKEELDLILMEYRQKVEIAIQEKVTKEELTLTTDESNRKILSSNTNDTNKRSKLLADLGLLTEERFEELSKESEGFEEIDDYPKALWVIMHKQDEDGWLANWLPQHPVFLELLMSGEWPDWLAPPPPSLDILQ